MNYNGGFSWRKCKRERAALSKVRAVYDMKREVERSEAN